MEIERRKESALPKKTISVRIDGELVTALEGQTVLEAARANGKQIPTLCHLAGLSDVGACRVCIVELSGSDRLLPACTTPIQDGMRLSAGSSDPAFTRNTPSLTCSMRSAIPYPCIDSRASVLSTSISSVP